MSTNDYTAYLAHYGVKGQKKGLRRFQSYDVAPTRSGIVGQEVGEAAKQSSQVLTKEQESHVNKALDSGESYQEAVRRQNVSKAKETAKSHAKIAAVATALAIGTVVMADLAESHRYTKMFGGTSNIARTAKEMASMTYSAIKYEPKKHLGKIGLAAAGYTVLGEIKRTKTKHIDSKK